MTEFQVNNYISNSQSNSTVAIDPNGNFVISWQSFGQDTDNNGIYAQRYNSAGVAQGSEFRVNSTTSGDQNSPTIAIDADGDFVISWTGQDASGKGIYAQRYNSAGVAQGSEFRVNSTTSGDQNNSTIAIDTVGDFVISWTGQDASGRGIYAQRYNSAGVAQGSEFRVNSTTSGDQNSSTVAIDADGDFVISWTSYGQNGQEYYGIYAQRYNSAGVAQGSEFQVNTTTTTSPYQLTPTIAMDAGGDFVISWTGKDGFGYGIYAQRYNSSGVAQGSEFQVNNTTIADQKNPTVAMDANGDFVISWQSYGQDGDNNGIYARRYNSSGVAQGSEFQVNNTTTDNQSNPSVAIAADGNFVISWQSFGQDTSSDGIYAQLYRNNGAPPIVTSGSASALAYIENATTAIDSGITVSDADSANLASATVSISSGFISAQDTLAFTSQNGITGSYNSSTGVLTLTGSSSVANYQTALRSITYTNSSDNPSTTPRSISFIVNDGSTNSTTVTRNINITAVNDAPIATATNSALAYTENATTIIDSGITVSDVDSANLSSATVSITSGFASTQDILAFTGQNGITGNYNSSTGVLTLTGSSSVANYQAALRSITYTNSSDNPTTTPRTISFVVNDGTDNSTTVTRNINITAVNNAPSATATNSALAYTENATIAIDSGITVNDVDSANLASATVRISSGFISAQDTLAFTSQNGITGSYNSSTGVLTLTGSSSVANYQTALRSITYTNSSDNPTTTPRTVSFVVNDGSTNSTTVTRNINITAVNDAPIAVNDSITTNKNTPIIISATTLLSNDTDAENDVLNITGFTQPSQGSVIDNSNGTYTYTPSQNYYGSDGFTYTISDGHGGTSTATVNLTINQITPPINGTSGADNLTGTVNMDIISGLQGNDTLQGLGDNDTLNGGDGNDLLDGGTGDDSLIGGKGNDTYVVDSLGDTIVESANAGTDLVKSSVSWVLGNNLENLTLTGSGAINGTGNSLNNILIGNTGANSLSGEAGNDNLFGDSGNDTLLGGAGNDTLDGGLGADSLVGGLGNDTYIVDNLNDTIIEALNAGKDLVKSSVTFVLADNVENLTLTGTAAINGTGNNLDNILIGNTGANFLSGGDGNDSLIGGAGNDTLLGGSGNDTLDGGLGSDSFNGGDGNDTYIVDNANDVITESPNAGTDLVKSSVTFVLADNLENLTLTGTAAINGTGNSLDNILIGNTGANFLSGGDGKDSLIGGTGNDTLLGGAGDDTLDGGAGIDSLIGGDGNDIYTVDSLNDTITEGLNAGIDLVKSSVTWTLGDNLENLTLTGTAAINGTGNSLDNILIGNAGANTLSGGDGKDSLFGSSGNDTLLGGAGDDTLDGGAGIDSLIGGDGNDIYTVDNVSDIITEGLNAGIDSVNSSVTFVLADNLENLTLTGTGAINGTGNSLNNTLIGNAGANTLSGGDGNDTVYGNSGNDTLLGGAGNDVLIGGIGRDVLTGGTGQDSLYLTDTRTGGYDIITDFTVGDDTIFISKAEFGLSQSQNTVLDSSLFRLGTIATTASDRFIYNQTTGNLFFDKDGVGGTAQVQIAQFSNNALLSSANITVIA